MPDPLPIQPGGKPPRSRPAAGWGAAVDWLGAQKPLEIILLMVAIVAAAAFLAHLLR